MAGGFAQLDRRTHDSRPRRTQRQRARLRPEVTPTQSSRGSPGRPCRARGSARSTRSAFAERVRTTSSTTRTRAAMSYEDPGPTPSPRPSMAGNQIAASGDETRPLVLHRTAPVDVFEDHGLRTVSTDSYILVRAWVPCDLMGNDLGPGLDERTRTSTAAGSRRAPWPRRPSSPTAGATAGRPKVRRRFVRRLLLRILRR
jgi:hypothetical protein